MAVKYVIDDETLTQIADPLRSLAGREDELTPAEMAAAGNAASTEVNTQTDLIAQIQTALEGKVSPGGGITPSGTIQITENGTHDVTAYASAEVNVPSDEPNIQPLNVTENGTYTPSGDVDGYGPVTVNVPTGGGGDEADILDGILTRNGPTEITNSRITSIGINALNGCGALIRASFPNVTNCDTSAFQNCGKLEQVDMPKLTTIGTNAFRNCASLQSISKSLRGPSENFV